MLYVLAGTVAVGAGVLYLLDAKTTSQHESWQRKSRQLSRETAEQHARIQAAIQHNAEYQKYRKYIQMHYASKQTADQAFELYQSSKDVLKGLYTQLKCSGEKIV